MIGGFEVEKLHSSIFKFLNDEKGVTAIEYALIASLIAVAIIVGASSLGKQLNNAFAYVCKTVNNNVACS